MKKTRFLVTTMAAAIMAVGGTTAAFAAEPKEDIVKMSDVVQVQQSPMEDGQEGSLRDIILFKMEAMKNVKDFGLPVILEDIGSEIFVETLEAEDVAKNVLDFSETEVAAFIEDGQNDSGSVEFSLTATDDSNEQSVSELSEKQNVLFAVMLEKIPAEEFKVPENADQMKVTELK